MVLWVGTGGDTYDGGSTDPSWRVVGKQGKREDDAGGAYGWGSGVGGKAIMEGRLTLPVRLVYEGGGYIR